MPNEGISCAEHPSVSGVLCPSYELRLAKYDAPVAGVLLLVLLVRFRSGASRNA